MAWWFSLHYSMQELETDEGDWQKNWLAEHCYADWETRYNIPVEWDVKKDVKVSVNYYWRGKTNGAWKYHFVQSVNNTDSQWKSSRSADTVAGGRGMHFSEDKYGVDDKLTMNSYAACKLLSTVIGRSAYVRRIM